MKTLLLSLFFSLTVLVADTLIIKGDVRCPYICDDNTKEGFLIELVKTIYEKHGHTVVYSSTPWARAIIQVREGKADAVIGIAKRNAPDLVFPDVELYSSQIGFFTTKEKAWNYTGLRSLKDIELGIIKDLSYGKMNSYIRRYKHSDKVQALAGNNALERNIRKLKFQRIDAVIEDTLVMKHFLNQHEDFSLFAQAGTLKADKIYLAFSNENPKAKEYVRILSEEILKLKRTALYQNILNKYNINTLKKQQLYSSLSSSNQESINQSSKQKAGDVIHISYASSNPKGSPSIVYASKFKELAEKYTNSKVKIELFTDAILGSEQDNVMNTGLGELEMGTSAANNLAPFAPVAGVMALPYIFPSKKLAHKVLNNKNIMNEVNNKIVESANVRVLSWLMSGYRTFSNSKRLVKSPSDLKGLKIRVPENSIMVETYRAWGIDPIPIAWNKTYEALATKLVDGKDNPLLNSITMPHAKKEFYEIQKYLTNIHYILLLQPHFVNEDFFQSLSPNLQTQLMRAAKDAEIYANAWVENKREEILQRMLKNGMSYTEPANNEEEWIQKARSVWPKFYEEVGGRELVEKILKLMHEK